MLMANFTVRVELHHSSTQQDYLVLHSAMERQGFVRIIRSDQGVAYHLPTAEYNYEGNADADRVLNAAKSAAAATGKTSSVLVSEATRRAWWNLATV